MPKELYIISWWMKPFTGMNLKPGSEKVKLDADEKINYLSLDDYNLLSELTEEGKYTEKVAVVYAEGDVVYNMSGKGMIDNNST